VSDAFWRGVDTLLIAKLTRAPLFVFLLVGGLAFVLDASIVWGLTQGGLDEYRARLVSIGAAMAFTFCLNRAITFRVEGHVQWREVVAYVGASSVGIILNYAIYAGSVRLGLAWLPAMALGTIIASAFNFLAYGRIFRKSAS
jgi:putative flippase GtrA